jgi:hypothetical protein
MEGVAADFKWLRRIRLAKIINLSYNIVSKLTKNFLTVRSNGSEKCKVQPLIKGASAA